MVFVFFTNDFYRVRQDLIYFVKRYSSLDCIQDTLSSRVRLAWRPSARASKGILHISLLTA